MRLLSNNQPARFGSAFTLLELMVVVVIISLLATLAVGVYTQEVTRAKIAKTRAEIRSLEVAINRYQIDTGQFPVSGTGTDVAPAVPNPGIPYEGIGYAQMSLQASLSGDVVNPLSATWVGPYMDWDENRMGSLTGVLITSTPAPVLARPEVQFLDPFQSPYYYIASRDYSPVNGGTIVPPGHPYYVGPADPRYYNPTTFQIVSNGANRTTLPLDLRGTDIDDITNWISPAP